MNPIPSTYLEIISPLIDQARRIMEQGESLVPFAFVGNLTREEILPVMLHTETDKDKDASAALIREIAREIEADFIFVITEAWSLPSEQAPRYAEIIAEYGSIGDSPHRVDIVSFTLETDHGIWAAQIPIGPTGHSPSGRTFTPPRFQYVSDIGGRLTSLLPDRNPTPRTLH
ncbi:hypothetical protein [Thiocystis violacea]|uniref:hypothetical protein n=1 Tax=Thiocystis violacea TaxID=13725 RepID=UPI001905FE73|nr:hypothetical protein [Thiocystis violacea]MBK1718457.1 hypothetical protein [Thiocystis violacea]